MALRHLRVEARPSAAEAQRRQAELGAGPIQAALLETRGARSGQPRRTATPYFHDGDRITIIASKAGRPEHPAWYYNVRAHPDVIYGGIPFRAQLVEDESEPGGCGRWLTAYSPRLRATASGPPSRGERPRSCGA